MAEVRAMCSVLAVPTDPKMVVVWVSWRFGMIALLTKPRSRHPRVPQLRLPQAPSLCFQDVHEHFEVVSGASILRRYRGRHQASTGLATAPTVVRGESESVVACGGPLRRRQGDDRLGTA